MAGLRLSLLGPFQVLLGGEEITSFESNKVRALLAVLAAEGERPQRREVLATLLWPYWPQQSALRNLTYALADLRKNLGDRDAHPPCLIISHDSLKLNPQSDIWVDIREFQDLASSRDTASLEEAVALYRGVFLEGFSLPDSAPFEEWLAVMREKYQRQMQRALSMLSEGHAQRGQYEQALVYARHQVELEPWLEEAHQQVMRLLALSGQRGAALAQYEACCKVLKNELGVGPGLETVRLYEAIRDGTLTAQSPEALGIKGKDKTSLILETPSESQKAPRSVLPVQMTTFIGRDKEIAQVKHMLEDNRLVTLTGAGGTGKTRLALQVAVGISAGFTDGVFFVDLTPVRDPDLVLLTIAGILGVRETEGTPLQAAMEYALRDRNLLLILDNFEQVLPAAGLVSSLLAAAPGLKTLVTSRASLQLSGERVFITPPLATPNSEDLPLEQLTQVESVALFLQRAQSLRPDFALTQVNAPAITAICSRLDGSPLEIELAAARMRLLSPETLLSHLDQRLGFLTSGARDLPARQQSLRATIEWSYNLLPEVEQNAFRRLAVFDGGFTLSAAEKVAVSPSNFPSSGFFLLDTLEALTNHNLVQVSEVEGEPRFSVLGTIREYALERLAATGEEDEARKQHAVYFLELAEKSHEGFRLYGTEQGAWVDRLEQEQGNLRSALAWTIEHQTELGLRLAVALGEFWDAQGAYDEGKAWLSQALSRSEGKVELKSWRGWALNWKGKLCRFQDSAATQDLAQESLDLFRELGNTCGVAHALCDLSEVLAYSPQNLQAVSLCQEGIALFRQMEDDEGLAWAYTCYVKVCPSGLKVPEHETFLSIVAEALRLNRKIGNQAQVYRIMEIFGLSERFQRNYSSAQTIFEENLTQARLARDTLVIVANLDELGWVMLDQGKYEEAKEYLEEALEIWRSLGCKKLVARGLIWLCKCALSAGDESSVIETYNKSLTLMKELNDIGKWEVRHHYFLLGRESLRAGLPQWGAVFLEDAIRMRQELQPPDLQMIARSMVESAGVALAVEKPEQAAWLLGVANVLLSDENRAHFEADKYATEARGRVGESIFNESWEAGAKLAREDLDKAVTETLILLESFQKNQRSVLTQPQN